MRNERDEGRQRARWTAWAGWILVGLALLAKGPQLPLLLIAGIVIAAVASREPRRHLAPLRFATGISIMLIVGLWWYIAVLQFLPGAMDIWRIETVDRISDENVALTEYLNPYYLYRTAGLLLPWVMWFPFVVLTPWIRDLKRDRAAIALWWIVIICVIGLSLSLGRRWYYMLPLLGVMSILMAAGGMWFARSLLESSRSWVTKGLLIAHIVLLVAAKLWMVLDLNVQLEPPVWKFIALFIAAIVASIVILLPEPTTSSRPGFRALAATAFVVAVFFAGATLRGSLWDAKRFEEREFIRTVARFVQPREPLLAWRGQWAVEQADMHRVIPIIDRLRELRAAVRKQPFVWLLVSSDHQVDVSEAGVGRCVISDIVAAPDERRELWLLAKDAPALELAVESAIGAARFDHNRRRE